MIQNIKLFLIKSKDKAQFKKSGKLNAVLNLLEKTIDIIEIEVF